MPPQERQVPPSTEVARAEMETTTPSPEVLKNAELSHEQLEQFAASASERIEEQATGLLPAAESTVASSAVSMQVSSEILASTRTELGFDDQLQAVGREAKQLAVTAQAEVGEVMASDEESVESEPRGKRTSIWEQAKQWREANKDRIAAMKEKKHDGSITNEYGKGVVNSKEKMCADNRQTCIDAYASRMQQGGREVPSEEELNAALEAGLKAKAEKRVLEVGRESVLFQEMTQEIAYADYQRRKEEGKATLGAEGIAADMLVELDLENKAEMNVASMEEAREAVSKELLEYIQKGYITENEAALIQSTVEKYGDAYLLAFEGKKFPGCEIMTRKMLTQDAYEGMRDNARKIAFQTKMDKRVFSGSDHGTRHICEGCTHFSETMMASMNGLEGVDFKPQDEVLIRQIIIDHDIGYTTDAAQAKGGFEASKDHPCAGCDFVESHKDYYVEKYGDEGYETIRDVVLNHSYVQTEYQSQRQEAAPNEITYNS